LCARAPGLVLEFVVEFPISGHERAGTADHEGDLVASIALVDEDHNTCKYRDIVLDGTEGMIEAAGDLVGLETSKVEAHGLDAMGLAGADVLLLAAGGDFNLAAT